MESVANVAMHISQAADNARQRMHEGPRRRHDANWRTPPNFKRSSKTTSGNGHGNGNGNNNLEHAREKYLDQDDIQADGLPACDYCHGLRRVRGNLPVSHPDFGKLSLCPVCGDLVKRQRSQRLYRKKADRINNFMSLTGRSEVQTFDSFNLREDEGLVTEPVRIALARARAFTRRPADFLVLHGGRGGGKTHLATAIANELKDASDGDDFAPLALRFIVPEFLELLRSGYDNGDYQEVLQLCKDVDVLILDDLGTESQSTWAYEKLFQVINYRYQRRLPTVVATNCDLRELESRIRSRLADDANVIVSIDVPDYRQREREPGLML